MLAFLDRMRKNSQLGSAINFFGYFYLSLWNHIFNIIPSYLLRYLIAKYFYGLKIGKSNIHMGVFFLSPWRIVIGDNCNIQMGCLLDGRGELLIGNNVDITYGVRILTEQHDIDDPDYATQMKKVTIEDHSIIGSYALILPGVTVREGCVIGAGSVVVKDTDEYCLVAGNPAVKKRQRKKDIKYRLDFKRPFH